MVGEHVGWVRFDIVGKRNEGKPLLTPAPISQTVLKFQVTFVNVDCVCICVEVIPVTVPDVPLTDIP
jgi:hypothetical protein